jgi:hypothetical protein
MQASNLHAFPAADGYTLDMVPTSHAPAFHRCTLGIALILAFPLSLECSDVRGETPWRVPKVEFRTLKENATRSKELGMYGDILNHLREEFKDYGDRVITAHELTHGINSHLRNEHVKAMLRRVNAFYVGGGRYVLLDEPGVRKSQVAEFVPKCLRGDRFRTYIEEQKDWDEMPLYLFDEWTAYVNGAVVAIEEARTKKADPLAKNDMVFACLEFSTYVVALGMAVEKHDREYFRKHEAFRAFLAWHLQRSADVFKQGRPFEQFAWRPDYLKALKTDADARPLCDFARLRLDLAIDKLFD